MKRAVALLLMALAGCTTQALEAPPPESAYVLPERTPTSVDHILVDKSDRTLTLYSGGTAVKAYDGLQLGGDPTGAKRFEGDQRTPEGRYMIDYRNPRSAYHLSLHISYPSLADREIAAAYGRSAGGEIFIHGQPNALPSGREPGDWTDGCIALSNAEIEELWREVPDGTPIDIRP